MVDKQHSKILASYAGMLTCYECNQHGFFVIHCNRCGGVYCAEHLTRIYLPAPILSHRLCSSCFLEYMAIKALELDYQTYILN